MASQIAKAFSTQSELPNILHSNTAQWQDALLWLNVTAGWSTWQYVVMFLLGLIVYDQGKPGTDTMKSTAHFSDCSCGVVMYIKRKGSIAGPTFKIPFVGPFFQALDPKFDGYLAQWASGPLSCVSVFHKYVYLAGQFTSSTLGIL